MKFLNLILENDHDFLTDYVKDIYKKTQISNDITFLGDKNFDKSSLFYSVLVIQGKFIVEGFYFRDYNFETMSSLENKTLHDKENLVKQCNNRYYLQKIYKKLSEIDKREAQAFVRGVCEARKEYKNVVLEEYAVETSNLLNFITSD